MLSFEAWLAQTYGIRDIRGLSKADLQRYTIEYSKYRQTYKEPEKPLGYDDYLQQYQHGDIDAIDFQGVLANNGIQTTPEQTQWINNEISQQVTNEARDYNTQMRDSSLTSSASQLSSLGLNPASVLQTGGSGIGSSPVSDTSKANPAQEKAMADFQNKAALTRTLIGLVGGLGSAGILGGTRFLARRAASVAASSAANSGIRAVTGQGEKLDWDKLVADLDNY